jgi:hypothetical protein
MMGRGFTLVLSGAFALFVGAHAGAVSPASVGTDSPLEVRLQRSKVVIAAGKENLEPAITAKPGDVLEEVVTCANKSAQPLAGVECTLPVPANTKLVAGSIKPGTARASVDGAAFESVPLRRKVRNQNGAVTENEVPIGEYRYLRWYPGRLDARQAVSFSARFKVNDRQAGK